MPLGSNLANPWRLIIYIGLQWDKTKNIFFSETTRTRASIFCMLQCLKVSNINCANHAPGVKVGHAPGFDSLHRLTMGKHSNINIFKASWRILIKLQTQHHLALEKVAYCLGQIRLELWLPWQHICFNGEKIKNLLL